MLREPPKEQTAKEPTMEDTLVKAIENDPYDQQLLKDIKRHLVAANTIIAEKERFKNAHPDASWHGDTPYDASKLSDADKENWRVLTANEVTYRNLLEQERDWLHADIGYVAEQAAAQGAQRLTRNINSDPLVIKAMKDLEEAQKKPAPAKAEAPAVVAPQTPPPPAQNAPAKTGNGR